MQKIKYINNNGFPPTVCIQLLKWCNLKCLFCRAESTPFENENLKFQDVERLLTELSKYGKWRISITGGEPFFWKGIDKLLKLIYELDFPFNLTTNGYSTNNILLQIPTQYWKNGRLHVSIDGNKKLHNELRREKSFEKAVNFIELARIKVPQLFVNTVLYTDPKLWVNEIYTELLTLKVNNWTIISPVKAGRWDSTFGEKLIGTSFIEQFEYIKSVVNNFENPTTTLTFLDFAKSDSKYADVVFVNSDGQITLPGFYNYDDNFPERPLIQKSSIKEENVANIIYESVAKYIDNQHYML